eukprot:7034-Heterococcus_DN1.PRE.4
MSALGGVSKTWGTVLLQGHTYDDASAVAAAAAQAKTTRFGAVAESVSRITYVCKCDRSFKTERRLLALSTAAASLNAAMRCAGASRKQASVYGATAAATPLISSTGWSAGAMQSLRWLAAAGYKFSSQYYNEVASSHGHLAVLQYLIDVAHCP